MMIIVELLFVILSILILGGLGLAATKGHLTMQHIKKIYLYLVSVVSLVILIIGGIMLINLGLRTWVFPKADHFSYPSVTSKADCERMKAEQTKNPAMTLPYECTDPDYEAKQREIEKNNRIAQKQQEAATALAMIIVAAPVWYGHWRLAKREA